MAEKGLIEFFLAEAEEHISALEQGFLSLEKDPDQKELIHDLFRSAHTLKGSAALVKLPVISEISHIMEDYLEEIRDGKRAVTKDGIDWLLHSLDAVKTLIADVVDGQPEREGFLEEVRRSLDVVKAEEPLEEEVSEIPEEPVPEEGVYEEKRDIGRRREDLETISNYVRVHLDTIDRMMTEIGELTVLRNYLVNEMNTINSLRDEIEYAGRRLLKEIEDFTTRYGYSIPDKVSYVDSLLEDFRELEFDRYDELNLFARKLQEITNDINEAMKGISEIFQKFSGHMTRLERISTDLKDHVSESRMVEAGRLFQRFTRVIRDLSESLGKPVRFIVSGAETRIDRMIYEGLFDPLLHIIRNAVSHGIEPPYERKEAGKPEEGRVMISARREGSMIVIDVKDDGRGIELKKVYEKAVSRGLITKGEKITRGQLLNLIFAPGFSTYEKTDTASGRGVGLDVVRQAVSEMNGTINVATVEGKGTLFRLKLPLTLIIVNTIRFSVGGVEFSVPSSLVQELVEIRPELIDEYGRVKLRDRSYEVRDLAEIFNLSPVRTGPSVHGIHFSLMPGKDVVLLVDRITGQEETVIRSLGGFLEGLRAYSGVSISADGKLTPVINPVGLLEEPYLLEVAEKHELVTESISPGNRVLIVDDSLSVRKFTSMLLEQKGYEVITASNGLEALNILDEKLADLIITDLEMPVMHGYEFMRELKRRGLIDQIPVLVLTSRGSEKHKEKAISLGARDYIIKPFEERELINTVGKYLGASHLT
ncbi:MAG: hybrid sensor histidine kinase/response regulator [Nitrospirae bacterium]|nr:MAG: hybrid sensor histidine kinase/response regulator [Nitrospirota bacterium]